jgi:phage-related protein
MDIAELSSRGEWKLARVIETVKGKDGLVRRAKISVGDKRLSEKGERLSKLSLLERPVQKLVLLLGAT